MAVNLNGPEGEGEEKLSRVLHSDPNVTIFLRPLAPPAAMGLAGFAGSTFIVASWICAWWGDETSPTIFFPFVALWGGLSQFIAGLYGFQARDVLVTVVHCMYGSFWMSIGLLYYLVAIGALSNHSIYTHFPELASWFVVVTFFTWSAALASTARDVVLCAVLTSLAIGDTIACCLYAFNPSGVHTGIKVAAYFWLISAALAWWRCTVYLMEEAYGHQSPITKFFPVFRTPTEKGQPMIVPGLGEPGVKRGMPGVI